MKVKDLIEALSKFDPEATVNTDDGAIHFIEELPGFYDGHYEEHIKDDQGHIVGIRYRRDGTKVWINNYTARDLYLDCDTDEQMDQVKFEYHESLHPSTVNRLKKARNEDRKAAVLVNDQVAAFNKQNFVKVSDET